MAWTSPKTWVAGDPLLAAELNVDVRDNQLFLLNPTESAAEYTGGSPTTTSATWVDVDATNVKVTLTTVGGTVKIWFCRPIFA